MLKKIDYRVLFELDDNARQSYGEIAEKVGTSKQVVGNHVKSLVDEGYVNKFLTVLDLSKLGLVLHKIYLRLIRASVEDELRILKFLREHGNVAWLVRTEGIYDIAFALHNKDVIELNDFLTELESKFGKFISEKIVNRIVTGEFFHRDYLVDKRSGFRKNAVSGSSSVDDVDLKILSGLCKDSRRSVVELSSGTGLSADAVGKRIKNLEREGVIKNYVCVLNSEKMGMLHYKVLLKISHFDSDVEKKFLDFCRVHKNITFYNKGIGAWEVELDMEVNASEDFRDIMRTVKKEFADFIREYFSLIVYDIQKFDFLPMGV